MQQILLKARYLERVSSQVLEKVNFFFQTHKGSGTNDQPLFRLQNKFQKIPLLVIRNQLKVAFE